MGRINWKDLPSKETPINATNLNSMQYDKTETGSTPIQSNGNPMLHNIVKGNSVQDGTPTPTAPVEIDNVGVVNLFDKDNANILEAYINASSKAVVGDTNNKLLYIPIEENKTYTISKVSSTRFRVGTSNVAVAKNITLLNAIDGGTNTSITLTTPSGAKYLCVNYYNSGTDTLSNDEILNSIQIEKGSVAHSYIPYGNWLVEKIVGKNILKLNNTINGYPADNNTIAIIADGISYVCKVKPNTTYTFSRSTLGTNPRCTIAITDEFPNIGVASNKLIQSTERKTFTFTTTSTSKYVVLFLNRYKTDTIGEEIQLNVGSEKLDYEPYKETKVIESLNKEDGTYYELNKIGDIADTYDYSTGVYENSIIKYTLTGNETITGGLNGSHYRYSIKLDNLLNNVSYADKIICLSTHFKGIKFNDRNNTESLNNCIFMIENGGAGQNAICVNTQEITSLSDFKTWLANNKPIVYYVGETPETIQLEKHLVPTYKGENNISIESNVEPTLENTYYNEDSYDFANATQTFDLIKENREYIKYLENKVSDLEPVVLWENPNPTSNFANQTITLNDSIDNYDYYEITYKMSASLNYTYNTGRIPSDKITMLPFLANINYRRMVTSVSGTSITFGQGQSFATYGTAVADNSYVIPLFVYGYKKQKNYTTYTTETTIQQDIPSIMSLDE